MAESSLLPERQLAFSPVLAATIGLEEAVLLQHLQQMLDYQSPSLRRGFAFYRAGRDYLLRTLPFWTLEDLHRVSRSLVDKGVLLIESPPLLEAQELVFALNEPAAGQDTAQQVSSPQSQGPAHPRQAPPTAVSQTSQALQTSQASPAQAPRRSAALLPPQWAPSEDLLSLLSLNHNIPRQFALDQLEDFIFYWRERGETSHAWENKFRQHVTAAWRREQQSAGEAFRQPEPPLDRHWRPSDDALEIMARAGIDHDFIEQAIPEFILYWRERGAAPKELNSKFIQHIRIQWARYSSSLTHSTEPSRISGDWQPSPDVFDILRMSHIDEDFARALLPEFIVYWRDSNQAHTSWNSKFLQHVKYHWARRHQLAGSSTRADNNDGEHAGPGATGRTRDRSLADDLTDTSWAG